MEVEHLVSYLYQVKGFLEGGERTLMTDPIEEIVGALRRGAKDREDKDYLRKYRRAWDRLKKVILSGEVYTLLPPNLENRGVNISAIVNAFESIAQECFPPLTDETIKLAKQIGEEVRELLKILEKKMGD